MTSYHSRKSTKFSLAVIRAFPPFVRQPLPTLLVAALSLSGCAEVQFYKVPPNGGDWEDVDGLEYYEPKPYLVIKRTKDGVSPEILMLPDVSQKRAVGIPGRLYWGSTTFTVEIKDGMLTKVSGTKDSTGSQTVGALGGSAGLVPALAALAPSSATGTTGPTFGQEIFMKWFDSFLASKTLATPVTPTGMAKVQPMGAAYKQVLTPVMLAIGRLGAASGDLATINRAAEKAAVDKVRADLAKHAEISVLDSDPQKASKYAKAYFAAQTAAETAIKTLTPIRDTLLAAAKSNLSAKSALNKIEAAISDLRSFIGDHEPVEVYEISPNSTGKGITFQRVYFQ